MVYRLWRALINSLNTMMLSYQQESGDTKLEEPHTMPEFVRIDQR